MLANSEFGNDADHSDEDIEKSCKSMLIISVSNKWKALFDIVMLFLVFFSSIQTLFTVAYPVTLSDEVLILTFVIEIFFYIDFVLNFTTAYQT